MDDREYIVEAETQGGRKSPMAAFKTEAEAEEFRQKAQAEYGYRMYVRPKTTAFSTE